MPISAALRISVLRTIYSSIRHGGRVIVFRGSRIHVDRGGRLSIAPGSRLILGKGRSGGSAGTVSVRRSGQLVINGDVEIFSGTRVVVNPGACLEIGAGSNMHHNVTVTCMDRISIGDNCLISWNANVLDGNIHELVLDGVSRPRTRPLHIGNDVWIGTGAIILAPVGDGAVIGAGSVVTSEVPERVVAGGNPAKVLKKNVSWHQ